MREAKGKPKLQPKLTGPEITAFLGEVFPQMDGVFEIEEIAADENVDAPVVARARVRMKVGEAHLRPGGTVSGPAMFTLADCAFYIATLAMIGREALTVTTNCTINFMRKPKAGDLLAEARILKLGRRLSVGDVTLFSEGMAEPVAHATLTYSLPQGR